MTFYEWWVGASRAPYWHNVEKRQARDVWFFAIQEAAKVCEGLRDQPGVDNGYGHGAHDCVGFIRALIDPEAP